MTWVFKAPVTSTIKGRMPLEELKFLSMTGCTAGTTTADNAVTQINKLAGVAGKAIIADEYMTRELKQGVEEQ